MAAEQSCPSLKIGLTAVRTIVAIVCAATLSKYLWTISAVIGSTASAFPTAVIVDSVISAVLPCPPSGGSDVVDGAAVGTQHDAVGAFSRLARDEAIEEICEHCIWVAARADRRILTLRRAAVEFRVRR